MRLRAADPITSIPCCNNYSAKYNAQPPHTRSLTWFGGGTRCAARSCRCGNHAATGLGFALRHNLKLALEEGAFLNRDAFSLHITVGDRGLAELGPFTSDDV